jgi:hypothetical protein
MTEQPGTGQPSGWAAPAGPSGPGPQQQSGWGAPTPPPPQGTQPSGWGTPPPPPPPGAGWGQPAWAAGPPPAPKPGIVPLRPLGFGEVLDGAFTAVQRYPKILLGLSALVVTGLMLVTFLVMFLGFADFFTSEDLEQFGGARIVSFVLSILVLGILFWVAELALTGMITVTVSQGVLGKPVTVRQVWDTAKGRILSLAGLTLLLGLAYLVSIGVVIAVAVGLIYATEQAGIVAVGIIVTVLLVLAWIAGVIYAGFRLALAPAALVLETRPIDPNLPVSDQRRLGVVESMRRSWTLTHGRFWRTFGLIVVSSLIAGVISSIIQYGFLFLAIAITAGIVAATSSENLGAVVGVMLYSIGTVGSMVLQMTFVAATNALVYVDARMRGEGLDLELANITGGDPTADAAHPWTAR